MAKWNFDGLLIHTRSVEKVLAPLVAQMSVLVNSGINEINGTSQKLVDNVLPNLQLAVCNFTSIAHEIGNVNSEIHDEMVESCDSTNRACQNIVNTLSTNLGKEKHGLVVEACRHLLSSITSILLLADRTAIRKLIMSIEKVDRRLEEIENVVNFKDFVHAFSQFGGDMVELAYISGERQNDLKDDVQRAEVCAARATLEKSTMMLLTTCKTCLRHPDSSLAIGNRSSVFQSMRAAMRILKAIIENNEFPGAHISRAVALDMRDLEERVSLISDGEEKLHEHFIERLDSLNNEINDIIDMRGVSEEKKSHVQANLTITNGVMGQLKQQLNEQGNDSGKKDMINVLSKLALAFTQIKRELYESALVNVEGLLGNPLNRVALKHLKIASLSGDVNEVESVSNQLKEEFYTFIEASRLVRNISSDEPCVVTASRLEENLTNLLPQLIDASLMLAAHSSSKITQENLEIFMDVWDTQVDELSLLLQNILQAEAEQTSADWQSVYIPLATKLNS